MVMWSLAGVKWLDRVESSGNFIGHHNYVSAESRPILPQVWPLTKVCAGGGQNRA
ncbi:MAG: hypothetical protein Ct9H300mP1_14540 [Planctomycetaceae bacterium]|nr:MAG: hypothetical protein Ct9H300mP1_14540 [Planctomycetaceae bacterium]